MSLSKLMMVNVDKVTPEKIVDAIKVENCNISQRFQFPLKEDKITVIANGCAIRPESEVDVSMAGEQMLPQEERTKSKYSLGLL